jgi:hypothetical protein
MDRLIENLGELASLYISREDEIEEDLKVSPGSRRLGTRVIGKFSI